MLVSQLSEEGTLQCRLSFGGRHFIFLGGFMDKKTYETLELNVYKLDLVDIVRTSPTDSSTNGDDLEWDWN